MPHSQKSRYTALENDIALHRFYQRIVDQAVPPRFQALFDRLREDDKELEHEA